MRKPLKSLRASLFTLALVALTCLPALATPIVQHIGDTDPLTESWTRAGNQPVGPVNDGGILAWQTADNSNSDTAYYLHSLTAADFASGWTYTIRNRVLNAPNLTLCFAAQDTTDYFSIWQAPNALYYLNNTRGYTQLFLMNTTDAYHTYQIVEDPLLSEWVGLYVDGAWRANIFRDAVPFAGAPHVRFGAGSGDHQGTANWDYAAFDMVPLPPTWVLLASGVLGLVGLRRRRRA